MSASQLIPPRTLHINVTPLSRTRTLLEKVRSISPINNTVNFWSSDVRLETKYEWMIEVYAAISYEIGNDKLSYDVIKYIELCLEKFADNYLSQVQVSGFESDNFGNEMMFNWFGFDFDAALDETDPMNFQNDPDLIELRDSLQKSYEEESLNLTEDDTAVTELFINISKMLIIKFLVQSLENMLMNYSQPEELSLFYLMYTAEYDVRFSIFRLEEYFEKGIIPVAPSKDGFTVAMLRLTLPDFIKENYDIRPSLEPGSIELLAGTSNIIVINEKSDQLVANIIDKLITPASTIELTIYFNLHRYILYLVFEEIQNIIRNKNDKQWTNAVVLDAINTATRKFRKQIM